MPVWGTLTHGDVSTAPAPTPASLLGPGVLCAGGWAASLCRPSWALSWAPGPPSRPLPLRVGL